MIRSGGLFAFGKAALAVSLFLGLALPAHANSADFIRGLDRADSVAVYTYSRNLNRSVALNRDRTNAIAGLRKAVAGDDSALYNSLLLTLRDAAKVPGRKVVIVFSNGPDNASMVAPDDVRAVAEDEGIPIYVISTNEVNKDPMSSNIFKRISTNTGGKTYFAWYRPGFHPWMHDNRHFLETAPALTERIVNFTPPAVAAAPKQAAAAH